MCFHLVVTQQGGLDYDVKKFADGLRIHRYELGIVKFKLLPVGNHFSSIFIECVKGCLILKVLW